MVKEYLLSLKDKLIEQNKELAKVQCYRNKMTGEIVYMSDIERRIIIMRLGIDPVVEDKYEKIEENEMRKAK